MHFCVMLSPDCCSIEKGRGYFSRYHLPTICNFASKSANCQKLVSREVPPSFHSLSLECVCLCAYIGVWECVRASLYACALRIHTQYVWMCACVRVCICLYLCMCKCTCVCMWYECFGKATIVSDLNQLTYLWWNVECILTTDVFTI